MTTVYLALALMSLTTSLAAVNPAKVVPPPVGEAKKVAPTVPKIDYMSNWGKIDQDGRKLTITGHAQWEATGEIRRDGTVYLLWILSENSRAAPGVYEFKDGKLTGHWGYAEDVRMLPDGSLTGELRDDTTYPVKDE